MADNTTLPGTGDIIADEDIGGVKYQNVIVGWGAAGAFTKSGVASGKPLPVQLRGSDGTDRSNLLPVTASQATAASLNATVVGTGTFAVQSASTLAAETTKVIGVTRTADGSGNLLTSTTNALDINIKSGANANGRTIPGSSAPVVMASQTYETVAASQTAQVMGGSGATGDYIDSILVVPATTSPGNVLLLDNATSITVFTGGSTSVSNLVPFPIQLGMISASGAWKITTGSNVSVIAIGNFS